jgi:hypothetical protein
MKNEAELAVAHEKNFSRIVRELAQELSLDPDELLASGRLSARGVDVAIVNHGAADYDHLTIFLDLGPIPPAREDAVNRSLLERNLGRPGTFGTFAVIPDTGHAALSYRFGSLDGITGEKVANVMRKAVDQHSNLESPQHASHMKPGSACPSRTIPPSAYSS